LAASDDQMITDDQVDQHLQWNEVDATHSLLSSVVHIPCGETPDIGVGVAGSYLKPKSWLKSCFRVGVNRLM